jgi:hypothetical protein
MEAGIDGVAVEELAENSGIADAPPVEGGAFGHGPAMTAGEVIEDHHLLAFTQEEFGGDSPNISGAAGDKHSHG